LTVRLEKKVLIITFTFSEFFFWDVRVDGIPGSIEEKLSFRGGLRLGETGILLDFGA